jgi:uncharacterized protein DUF6484
MKTANEVEDPSADVEHVTDADSLLSLVLGRATTSSGSSVLTSGIVIGELIGMTDGGRTPLVVYPGQVGTAAIAARSVLDLHGTHIGRQVVLVFEGADPAKPIVMGVLRDCDGSAPEQRLGKVEVDSDGERMIVDAKQQLVLRCGRASITLTKAGKVLIEGAYVSSRSTGINRVKGGSVQLN